MKNSLIITVLNEKKTLESILNSISNQSLIPDEVVVIDGNSIDDTFKSLEEFKKKKNLPLKIGSKFGNRSVGRNEAVRRASGDIILCTDAGCILDKNWVKEIIKPFSDPSIDVVAGYYKGVAMNVFQKCLIPYVLVMEDKVNDKDFLPATRSMAFRKSAWKKIGGFPEEYSHNEDYVFANRLRDAGMKIAFAKKAIVSWIPRNTFRDAFWMFYRFAYGDAEARLFRFKVLILFIRYIIAAGLLVFPLHNKSLLQILIILVSLAMYILWAILKNYRYVQDIRAIFYLPLLQFLSDAAVISGTVSGVIHRNTNR